MLKEVNKHIRDLERRFFEEEDSEAEEYYKNLLLDEDVTIDEHNKRLEDLKNRSHITQFFSIPLSVNIRGDHTDKFDFEKLRRV